MSTDPQMQYLKYCDTSWPILGLGISCAFLNISEGQRFYIQERIL
jgi:hypothetical protein